MRGAYPTIGDRHDGLLSWRRCRSSEMPPAAQGDRRFMNRRTPRAPLDRFLTLFAEVHAGEAGTVVLLTVDVFLLLTAYYIIKPVREALILSGGGAEVKSYAAAGQALLLLVAVPAYARLASRLPRLRLIGSVTVFFSSCLVVFYLLAHAGLAIGVPFYLWVGIFNVMIVAQFWSFANDVYTPAEGQRLFAIVGFGASSGAVFGSFLAGRLVEPLGINQLMLLSAVLLLVTILLTREVAVRRRAPTAPPNPSARSTGTAGDDVGPLAPGGAFRLLLRNRYLLLIALLILFINWVNTTGEFLLGRIVTSAAETAVATGTAGDVTVSEYIGKFYADFLSIVGLASLLIQLFLVSRAIKYLGVRVCLLILPAIALGGYLLLASIPVLTVVRWAKTAENATDYSLQNTIRNVLFLPTTREEKYKAKQAIDTFFQRAGDVLSALVVFVGTELLALTTSGFAVVNAVLVLLWLTIAAATGRRYYRLRYDGSPSPPVTGTAGRGKEPLP
jgi:AAA family ATP:ADP antiporter